MNKFNFLLVSCLVIALFAISDSFAQMGMWGSGGWGMGGSYCGMYSKGAIETINGEVLQIEKFTPSRGMHNGIQLIVKTDKETISVHLGPEWYIEKQDFKIAVKDKITIKGPRITFNGKPAIMASEVKNKNSVLKLWNDNGYPLWSGHGWR